MQFMMEGGFGMWPVLVFGLVGLVGAARYAWNPLRSRLPFVAAMAITLVSAAVHATWIGLGAVFHYLESPERAPDADVLRVLFAGLKEITRPGALGGVLLTLVLLVVAIGLHRAGLREERT